MYPLTPVIVGKGMSGQALAKSFAILGVTNPEFNLAPSVFWQRGRPLAEAVHAYPQIVLGIANPHGLHAQTLLEAAAAGIKSIILEKPACVSPEQVTKLREIKQSVAVLHGYRTLWGPRTLRELRGELGALFSIEGRYWQSSAAEGALKTGPHYQGTWKADPNLGGRHGVLLDLATHWLDLAAYTSGAKLDRVDVWKSSVLSDVDYLDTHVHVSGSLAGNIHLIGSISKVVHGATNNLEITLLGEKGSASWSFLNPDEIILGKGRDRTTLTRKEKTIGLQQPAFHGGGWIDGFTEVCRQALNEMVLGKTGNFPRLHESLDILEVIFKA